MKGRTKTSTQTLRRPSSQQPVSGRGIAVIVLTLLLPGIVRIMNLLGRIKLLNWGMEQLSQYSLSVFLYQPLAFLLLHRLMMLWERLGLRHSVQFVCCCVLIVPMAVILAALFGPLERLGKRRKA